LQAIKLAWESFSGGFRPKCCRIIAHVRLAWCVSHPVEGEIGGVLG